MDIQLKTKRLGHVRIQYLAAVAGRPGMYKATKQTDMYTQEYAEHTFVNTVFVQTTTCRAKTNRKKKKQSKDVTVVTKEELDADVLVRLSEECAARPARDEEEEQETG